MCRLGGHTAGCASCLDTYCLCHSGKWLTSLNPSFLISEWEKIPPFPSVDLSFPPHPAAK